MFQIQDLECCHLLNFQNVAFSRKKERKFAKIPLPDWQFYLPQAIRQWDMLSPAIDNMSLLVEIMAWYWICNKPSSQQMLAKVLDAI